MSITPQMRASLFQEFLNRSSKFNIFPTTDSNPTINQSITDLNLEAERVQGIFQNIRKAFSNPLEYLINLIHVCPMNKLKSTYEQFITLYDVDIATENRVICYLLKNNMPSVLGLLFEEQKHEIIKRFISSNDLTSFLCSSIGSSHDPKMLAFWNENDRISNMIAQSMIHLQLFLIGLFSIDPHQNLEMPLKLVQQIFKKVELLPIACQLTLRNFLKSTNQPKRTFFNFILQTYLPEMNQHKNLLTKALNNFREMSLEELLELHYCQRQNQFCTTSFLMKILRCKHTDEELQRIAKIEECRSSLMCYLRSTNNPTHKNLLESLRYQ